MSRIFMGFLGNMLFDTRTSNLFHSLKSSGHSVFFAGFDWETPGFKTIRSKHVWIHRLKKNRVTLFYYIHFAVLLSVHLIRKRSDVVIASDFYALPFCAIAARFRGARLIYDSREIYTEMPSFHNRRFLKSIVRLTEAACVKKARGIFTTGAMDSKYIKNLYGVQNTMLLRNLPLRQTEIRKLDVAHAFPQTVTGKILVYQGILVPGRGIETAFQILQQLPSYGLVLLGEGVFNPHYKQLAVSLNIRNRVVFAGRIPQSELLRYTAGCDIGLCLIENICGNNYYALPNKLFEYVMAGLPVLVTDLPQMKAVVKTYGIGGVIPENDSTAAARMLKQWEKHPAEFRKMRNCCRNASKVLNWETEFEKIEKQIFSF